MRGVVIAAGLGSRMGALTESQPKCLLPIGSTTLLDNTLANLRAVGCEEVIIIVGYQGDAIRSHLGADDVIFIENKHYRSNNILHSFMMSRRFLKGPVIATYSDIWVEPWVFECVARTAGDIVLAVDEDWRDYYDGRKLHPLSEAENVLYNRSGKVERLGKHVMPPDQSICGEFLGLWKTTEDGTEHIVNIFDSVDATIDSAAPFQHSKEWVRAYMTDLFQEMIDRGATINAALTRKGWAELDTVEDYERLPTVALRQKLKVPGWGASYG